MPVAENEIIRQFFTCNGVTTTFVFTTPAYAKTELLVYKRLIATGYETLLADGVDYTITPTTGNNYLSGGTVTIDPALADTYEVIIVREITKSQETSSAVINPASVAAALDKLSREVQDLHDKFLRGLRIPNTDPSDLIATIPNSIARANKYASYDSLGNPTASAGPVGDSNTPVSAFMEDVLSSASASVARDLIELGTAAVVDLIDEDSMATDSATKLPSQQSVKAYVLAQKALSIAGVMSYGAAAGSDSADKTVTLPFVPKYVRVWNASSTAGEYWQTEMGAATKSDGGTTNTGTDRAITVSGSTVTFVHSKLAGNKNGTTFYYVAFAGTILNPS